MVRCKWKLSIELKIFVLITQIPGLILHCLVPGVFICKLLTNQLRYFIWGGRESALCFPHIADESMWLKTLLCVCQQPVTVLKWEPITQFSGFFSPLFWSLNLMHKSVRNIVLGYLLMCTEITKISQKHRVCFPMPWYSGRTLSGLCQDESPYDGKWRAQFSNLDA